MKNTKKTYKRQLFTQSSLKTITTSLVFCILICSGAIASSGICRPTNTTTQEQQKILTRKDIGPLLLSLPLIQEREQRLFLQQTLQQLSLKGELTEDEVQSIASQFPNISEILLLCDIQITDWGIVYPLPGFIFSFVTDEPIFSFFISAYGKMTIDNTSHGLSSVAIIGFFGTINNYRSSRNSWRYNIAGKCLICLVTK